MSAVATPLLELRGVSKRFVKRLDLAGRIARKLGAAWTRPRCTPWTM
jgi:peptide/nickel transport system ATP-binding protein